MRKIVHISDLHLGAENPRTLEPLLRSIGELQPHVLAVSGDLTQRATSKQFDDARAFLARVPCLQQVVVPGNHDVPLWNLWERLIAPRRRFDAHITGEAFPEFVDDELALIGLNSARGFTWKNGRVSAKQLDEVLRRIRRPSVRPGALRILVCHHPFVVPEGVPVKECARRSETTVATLIDGEMDLLLTGHRHVPWISPLGSHLPTIHAGTATSMRTRGTSNSFNEIVVHRHAVRVRRFDWQPGRGCFAPISAETQEFQRDESGRLQL